MIATLYRYPHPSESDKFIYVGQTIYPAVRDKKHRKGTDGFGRRFKSRFPNTKLPEPIQETVEVKDPLELNELETIWMFRFHTWYGYEGGMNLTIPGAKDYENLGKLGGRANAAIPGHMVKLGRTTASIPGHMAKIGRISCHATNETTNGRKGNGGRISGRKNVESGHLASIATFEGRSKGGYTGGRKAVESGQLASIRTFENRSKGGRIGGPIGGLIGGRVACCARWNIRRGKPCVCGKHQIQIEDSWTLISQTN